MTTPGLTTDQRLELLSVAVAEMGKLLAQVRTEADWTILRQDATGNPILGFDEHDEPVLYW
jgi:hypothetical protein